MRTLSLTLLLASCPLVFADAPATAPATSQPTLFELREAQRLRLLATMQNLTDLPAQRVGDVISLSIVDGLIHATCPFNTTDGVHRIALTDLPGLATLNVGTIERTIQGWIDFQHVDFVMPESICTTLQVFARDDYVQIAFDFSGVKEDVRVQLIQAPQLADDADGRVRLYMERYDAVTEDQLGKFSRSAAGVDKLLSAHRNEMARYVLRPLFSRKLHRGFLVTPAEAAWQVLGDSAPPPAEVVSEVRDLVQKLDSEKFADRESAGQKLRGLGPAGALALRLIDRSAFSVEQQQAVDAVVAAYARVDGDRAAALRDDPLFLVGVLYGDTKPLWPAAGKRLAALSRSSASLDESADHEAAARAADEWLVELVLKPAELLPPPGIEPPREDR